MDKKPVKKRDPNTLVVEMRKDDDEGESRARTILRPTVQAALTLQRFSKESYGEQELMGLVSALSEQNEAVIKGNMDRSEAMLMTQAHTLDAIFNTLAKRAALNMGEYLNSAETYMRLALKAQSQCRTTLEALATIKNPPIMGYVQQANIAHGPQQVNNGVTESPHARENKNPQNKLLEENDGERLDTGTTSKTGNADPAMATLGEIDRAKDG